MDDRQNKSGTSKPVTGKISTALLLLSFFQFGTGGNAQEGQACSKCAHLSHTREPIRIKCMG